jgi:DNA-binding beta-propeller fold protein YncE
MKRTALMILLLTVPVAAAPPDRSISFSQVWTHSHTTPGQVSEIPEFDSRTNTIWVVGIVGVDVLNADSGALVEHLDVTDKGFVNSVAIHNGLAALAVEAGAPDRRNPGVVLFYDTRTRSRVGTPVTVGSLPDMLTFTHDGSKLLVANEATPNAAADTPYSSPDPAGSVSIIDVETRTVIATAGFAGVPQFGDNLRTNVGMDFEPEYITVEADGSRAFVTLQEANGIAVLDLSSNTFTEIIGLGAKDFSLPGNEFDPIDNDGKVEFINAIAKGLYMPDSIASYKFRGNTYLVLANEGDYREDNADRSSSGAPAPLNRLRVSNKDSSPGNLYAAGARSMSIRAADGSIVYDSGSILEVEANRLGVYDDGRSRDKGVEPEGVALLDIRGRTYAFVGLERALSAAVAIFDVTDPYHAEYLDMIVTPGNVSPEGLSAFAYRGNYYLAIANEIPTPVTVPPSPSATAKTTLYKIDVSK